MKLSFESNLQYQQEAIRAVVGLFEGQTQEDSLFQYDLNEKQFLKIREQLQTDDIQQLALYLT